MRISISILLISLMDVRGDEDVLNHDTLTKEVLDIKTELAEQRSLTNKIAVQLSSIREEQLRNKDDIASLNFKTVSLYTEMSDSIQQFSSKLTQLEEQQVNLRMDMQQRIEDLQTKLSVLENSTKEENPKFEELEEKLEDLKEKNHEKDTNIYRDINALKGNLNAGKYALASSLEETNYKIDKHLKSAVSLESLSLKTLETVAQLEAKANKSVGLQDELASFRLLVARDTAKLRFEEGKWVTVQKRGDYGNPRDYFQRTFDEYTHGFGDPNREFWLGLDRIHSLTSTGATLRIQLETWQGEMFEGEYEKVEVGGAPGFELQISGFTGVIGDCLRIANGMKFSTWDVDQDSWHGSCSDRRGRGGWWFNGCGLDNLNGENLGSGGSGYDGILWFLQDKSTKSFKSSTMMIKKLD